MNNIDLPLHPTYDSILYIDSRNKLEGSFHNTERSISHIEAPFHNTEKSISLTESTIYKNKNILTTENNNIINFYKTYKQFNFEIMNILFIELFENNIIDKKNIKNEKELIHKIIYQESNTTLKCNKDIGIILSKIYPNDFIMKINDSHIILRRLNKQNIYIKNVENLLNTNNDDVNSFIEILKTDNVSGIFISQYSGIVDKPNYYIEIYNNNILLYIQNCYYNYDKIKDAVDIFDNLYKVLANKTNEININKKLFDEIFKEYEYFNNYKMSIIKLIQNNNNNVINYTKKMNMDNLHKCLSNFYVLDGKSSSYTCDICNVYISNTLKGIAAHKKGCKKKNIYKENINL